jgi:hypothetical protein
MTTKQVFNTSAELNYPTVLPTLDLDFANSKTLDPRITFTRSSGGSYVGADGLIKYAGVNEARFDHNPVTGESLGLLIEEQRTNLINGSDDFGILNWSRISQSTISANVITAPDGTTTADKFIENTLSVGPPSHKVIAKDVTISANTTYTVSIFVKAAERANIMIHLRETSFNARFGGFFNLSNKTFINETAGGATLVSSSITPLPNEWYRLSISGNLGAITASVVTLYLTNSSNYIEYAGNGNSGLFIWGAQLEAGAFPTSYIPTQASTVTRAGDTAVITNISSFFNASEGTLCVDSEMPYQTDLRFPAIGFKRNIGGSNNTIQFYYYNTSSPNVTYLVRNSTDYGFIQVNSALFDFISSPSQTVGVYKKFIGTYNFNEFNFYFDGRFVGRTTPNKKLPSNLTTMDIGTNDISNQRLNGRIRRITYYPKPLPISQLQALTR